MDLTDQPGEKSWPIVGASYILLYRDQEDKKKAEAMLDFFDWCYKRRWLDGKKDSICSHSKERVRACGRCLEEESYGWRASRIQLTGKASPRQCLRAGASHSVDKAIQAQRNSILLFSSLSSKHE